MKGVICSHALEFIACVFLVVSCGGNPIEVALPYELHFKDTFDRPDALNWGSPELGGRYTYQNQGQSGFYIDSNIGFFDSNPGMSNPAVMSEFASTSSSYRLEFSWKYYDGRGSGISLFNDNIRVIGISQEEAGGMLRFFNGSSYVDIESRRINKWNNYRIEIIDSDVYIYVNSDLKLTTYVMPSSVDNIRFWASGPGAPSDSWYDDVLLYSSFISE